MAFGRQTAARKPLHHVAEKTPCPGEYTPTKVVTRAQGAFLHGTGHEGPQISQAPPPGAYENRKETFSKKGGNAGFGGGKKTVGPKIVGHPEHPGPTYDPPPRRIVGGDLGSGHQGPAIPDTPCPAAYSPVKRFQSAPQANFGTGHEGPQVSTAPAPGAYDNQPKTFSAKGGNVGFGSEAATIPPKLVGTVEGPGPAAYTAPPSRITGSTMSSGHQGPVIPDTPCPAAYAPVKRFQSSPGANFGTGHEGPQVSTAPAPGAYEHNAKATFSAKGGNVGFGGGLASVGPKTVGVDGPGPAFGPTPSRIRGGIMGSGHNGPLVNDTPSPGAYETHSHKSVGSLTNSTNFGTGHEGPAVSQAPGPGAYEAPRRLTNIQHGLILPGSPASLGPKVIEGSPGPGYMTHGHFILPG